MIMSASANLVWKENHVKSTLMNVNLTHVNMELVRTELDTMCVIVKELALKELIATR